MAHVLELSDGSTTIDFVDSSGTSWCLIEDGGLHIERPRKKTTWTGGYIGYSGMSAIGEIYENRKITLTFEVVGDDYDDVANMLTSIVRLLRQSLERSMYPDKVPQVYLKYQIDTLSNPVYFDVITGNMELPPNIMSLEALSWVKGSQQTIKGFELELVCKPLARGAEVLVASGDETIANTDDGYYNNYLALSGSSIDGDVPGPLRVLVLGYDQGGGGNKIYNPLYMGVRTRYNASYNSVLEAEDGNYTAYGGILSSQSTALSGDTGGGSGGYAVTNTLTTTDKTNLYHWRIEFTEGQYTKGKVRALAVGSFSADARYRLINYYPSSISIEFNRFQWLRPPDDYTSTLTTNHMFDMGVVDLMPYNLEYGDSNLYSYLIFQTMSDSASSTSTRLDAIILIPAEDYRYRKLTSSPGEGIQDEENGFEDVGIRDTARQVFDNIVFGVGSYHLVGMELATEGLPLYADPGVDARIYFASRLSNYLYDPSWLYSIAVYHTPLYYNIRGTD